MVRVQISIEICSNCKEHAWCTRHNEATYLSLAEELQRSVKGQHQNAIVSIVKVGGQKMGSFEVTCNGYLLFSKLALAYFPHTTLLTNRISQFIEDSQHGKDLLKYKNNLSPLKHHPSTKHNPSESPEKQASMIKPNLDHKNQEKGNKHFNENHGKPAVETVHKPAKVEDPKKEQKQPIQEVHKLQPQVQAKKEVKQVKVDEIKKAKDVKKSQPKEEHKPVEKQSKKKTEESHHQPEIKKEDQPHHQVKEEKPPHQKIHHEKTHHQTPKEEIHLVVQQPKKEAVQLELHHETRHSDPVKKAEVVHHEEHPSPAIKTEHKETPSTVVKTEHKESLQQVHKESEEPAPDKNLSPPAVEVLPEVTTDPVVAEPPAQQKIQEEVEPHAS